MRTSLAEAELSAYLARQLSNFYPDGEVRPESLARHVNEALERSAGCFSAVRDKYLPAGPEGSFDHLHTDQYAAFLYFVANTIHCRGGDRSLAAKIYALNKALHGLDVYFEVELPEVFYFIHPVGTVLGRATYANFFIVYQRCTVGGNERVYPTLGEGLVMYGGSSVIGGCTVGPNVRLSAGCAVFEKDIPGDSVVFGMSPALTVKPAKRSVLDDYFRRPEPKV